MLEEFYTIFNEDFYQKTKNIVFDIAEELGEKKFQEKIRQLITDYPNQYASDENVLQILKS
jgi:hypothetical protein